MILSKSLNVFLSYLLSSICQIGFVIYENGQIKKEWSSLLNPEDYFDFWNESIHNITEEDVIEEVKEIGKVKKVKLSLLKL